VKPAELTYQIIDHAADIGIIVQAADIKDLFMRAAYAMTDIMVEGDIEGKRVRRELTVEGEDLPDLMVRWLGEVLYLFEAEKLIVRDIEITSVSETELESVLSLVRFRKGRHQIAREIKGVTYHQISVERKDGEWEARIIFDI
jgi:SHS2 domain-containing protein